MRRAGVGRETPMRPNERVTQDRPPARDGANEQPTLYGDIKPDPVTTATFLKGDRPLLVPAYGIGVDSTSVLVKLKRLDRKSTRLNSSHANISYAVFCLKKKNKSMPPFVSGHNDATTTASI